jgi:EamA domain-containing membrane protein RarD
MCFEELAFFFFGLLFLHFCCLTNQRRMRFSEVAEVAAVFVFFKLLVLCVCCLTEKQGMRFAELQEVIEDFFFFVFVVLLISGRCVFQRWQK